MRYLSQYLIDDIRRMVSEDYIVLLPVGSIELHGKHLPLNADTSTPTGLAARCVESGKGKLKLILTDPIPFGIGVPFPPEEFPGNMIIRPQTFISLVTEILTSLVRSGFRRIVIFNGHMPNLYGLGVACLNIMEDFGISPVLLDYWEFAATEIAELRKSEAGGIYHACEMETNLQLVFQPEFVDMSKARKQIFLKPSKYSISDHYMPHGAAYSLFWYHGFGKGINRVQEPIVPGLWGDPTISTREDGEKWVEAIVTKILDFLFEFKDWDTRCVWKYSDRYYPEHPTQSTEQTQT
jgi:creatinine amidohydrolase